MVLSFGVDPRYYLAHDKTKVIAILSLFVYILVWLAADADAEWEEVVNPEQIYLLWFQKMLTRGTSTYASTDSMDHWDWE